MPVLDEEQMYDQVMLAINTAWTAAGAASENLTIGWEGISARPPTGVITSTTTQPVAWCWNTIRPLAGRQATFGAKGNRRFKSIATFRAQIFAPQTDGLLLAQRLGKIVQEALEDMKTAGGVIADEVRPEPVGKEGRTWFRYDVLATLKYERTR